MKHKVVQTPAGLRVVEAVASAPAVQAPLWAALLRLIRFDRPIGWLLLLWPTLIALWLAASGIPPWQTLLIFVAGVFLTRSAGCIINDYADRWLDPQVARTRARPLATGEISGRVALGAFAVLMLLAFGLVCLTNVKTIGLSVLALLLAVLYPYSKRVIWYPQVVLGIAFSMGIPMAWTAVGQPLDSVAGLLFCANLLWTVAYDTQYAMIDREDDARAGARSTALLFGEFDRHAVLILQCMALLGMLLLGVRAGLGWIYYAALALCVVILGVQALWLRERLPADCLRAFRSNNWVGLCWFAGVALDLALRGAN